MLKKMSPAAIDFEIRSLSLANDFQELKSVLRMIQYGLQTGKNFELIEAVLRVFLQVRISLSLSLSLSINSERYNLKTKVIINCTTIIFCTFRFTEKRCVNRQNYLLCWWRQKLPMNDFGQSSKIYITTTFAY
jgi:hypothetical protein